MSQRKVTRRKLRLSKREIADLRAWEATITDPEELVFLQALDELERALNKL